MREQELYTAVGAAVLAKRRHKGMTQSDLAKKIGVSRESIANIEAGRQRILLHHVYSLMSALGAKTILDLIPAAPSRQSEPTSTGVEITGAQVSEAQRSDIDRLLSTALGERSIGSSS